MRETSCTSDLSIRRIIAHLPPRLHHLPHLFPPSLSVHLLPPRLLYARNKSERASARTHARLAETIGSSCWGVMMVFWIFMGNVRAGLWDTGGPSVNAPLSRSPFLLLSLSLLLSFFSVSDFAGPKFRRRLSCCRPRFQEECVSLQGM